MSNRKTAITVGILFFVQMITAVIGNSIITTYTNGGSNKDTLPVGVLFMVLSGIAVVSIGVLMYRVLKAVNKNLAIWYPVFRVGELMVTVFSSVYLLTRLEVLQNHMLFLYIPTALGGLIFTYLLLVSKIVPRPLASLGIIGYALLLSGTALDFMGALDIGKGIGQILLAPGGLFEFIFLPIWLITKGFRLESER